jgi:hypothetical protein
LHCAAQHVGSEQSLYIVEIRKFENLKTAIGQATETLSSGEYYRIEFLHSSLPETSVHAKQIIAARDTPLSVP